MRPFNAVLCVLACGMCSTSFASSVDLSKGTYLQCVTELFDASRPPGTPRLKQLWHVAIAPNGTALKVSLIQSGKADPKAENYVVGSRFPSNISGRNGNGMIARVDLTTGVLTIKSNESDIYIKGNCDPLL